MTDTVYRELDLPCSPSEAWEHVIDPSWLGEDGDLPTTPVRTVGSVTAATFVTSSSKKLTRTVGSPIAGELHRRNHREWKSNSRQSLKERASRSRSHRSR